MCSLVISGTQSNTVHAIVEMLFVILLLLMKLTMNAVKAFQTYQNKVLRHFVGLFIDFQIHDTVPYWPESTKC